MIMADPHSPLNQMRAFKSLRKQYPFLLPDVSLTHLNKAAEQQELAKPSELVRCEISNQASETNATLPIRKDDLTRLDLLTGDGVVVTMKKTDGFQFLEKNAACLDISIVPLSTSLLKRPESCYCNFKSFVRCRYELPTYS